MPPRSAMYWRGAMMWDGAASNGKRRDFRPHFRAKRSAPRAAASHFANGSRSSRIIRAGCSRSIGRRRPPRERLSRPAITSGVGRPIRKTRQYEVVSYGEIAEQGTARNANCRRFSPCRATISPAVRELAQSWAASRCESARRSEGWRWNTFGTQGFRYSLAPGEYEENGLDDFLFSRRVGFCEHYAGSFATLMRLAGIPSRVVAGYLGGEFNAYGGFFIVRQSDAHAWCEVWLPDAGWQRVDVTSVVAPDRVNLGFQSFLERRTARPAKSGCP